MNRMGKFYLILVSVCLSVLALSGCSDSSSPKESMTPVPKVSATQNALPTQTAAREIGEIFDNSILAFSQGGSQAVHLVDSQGKSSNIVAVNPAIYNGMVRLSIRDGEVVDPRADVNISTQLNVLNDILKRDNLKGVEVVYVANTDKGKIVVDESVYDLVFIDNKVSKIVYTGEVEGSPVKVTYVYSYGDKSYDEAIRIVAEAVNKLNG